MNKLSKEEAAGLLSVVDKCLKTGEFEKVLGFLKSLDQNNFLVIIIVGEMLRKMGKTEEAVASFLRAQELFELDFIRREGLDLARMSLEEINRLPTDPRVSLGLALCRKDQGNLKKAVLLLKDAARELYPDLKKPRDFVLAAGESSESPEGIFRRAEIFEAAELFADAFNLLCSLVSKKMTKNISFESAAAGR